MLIGERKVKRMLGNIRCEECKEKSKRVVGFSDGAQGGSCLFDCDNLCCEVKAERVAVEEKEREAQCTAAKLNAEHQIVAKDIANARFSKRLTLKAVADAVGISVAKLSGYEHEREAIPKELYLRITEYIESC